MDHMVFLTLWSLKPPPSEKERELFCQRQIFATGGCDAATAPQAAGPLLPSLYFFFLHVFHISLELSLSLGARSLGGASKPPPFDSRPWAAVVLSIETCFFEKDHLDGSKRSCRGAVLFAFFDSALAHPGNGGV